MDRRHRKTNETPYDDKLNGSSGGRYHEKTRGDREQGDEENLGRKHKENSHS